MKPLARVLLTALAALAVAAPGASALEIHAHRGGTLVGGTPLTPENSRTAFLSAGPFGADVVELDVHVSKDNVPFVMHDATLDRTTDCSGSVSDRTAAEIDGCHIDIIGTTDVFRQVPGATEPVPRLANVVSLAKARGLRLNIEINHYPTDAGYESTPGFVASELDTIEGSGIAKSRVLMQSFLPANLDEAKKRGFRTALITFAVANSGAVQSAQNGGYDVLEPQWPVEGARAFVKSAHAAGKRVIPFTLDKRADILAASHAGVDGLITDDPPLARGTLECDAAGQRVRLTRKRLKAARAASRRAHTPAARRRAAKRLAGAKRAHRRAVRAHKRTCNPDG